MKAYTTGILLIGLSLLTGSCVNLKSVHDFSSASVEGITAFEQLPYTFTRHCIDKCQFDAIRKFEIRREMECQCTDYYKADSVTLLLYSSLRGYFDGLTDLSNNELTDYTLDALQKSLTEGTFGDITVEKEQVEAYSKISQILLKATTDLYRKRKLKIYIEQANAPLQVLLKKFQFILQKNLKGELAFKREKLYAYYQEMKLNKTLTDYEKGKAGMEYYQQLSDIQAKQAQIDAFAESLQVIATGHQTLYDRRNKMTAGEIQRLLTGYASNIQDIISEFNKLKS